MSKLNVTPGEWQVVDTHDDNGKIIIWDGDEMAFAPVCDMGEIGEMNYNRALSDAKLIADAGTTYNKCHKLPSELMQENEELREALQYFIDKVDNGYAKSKETYEKYKTLLTKHSQK